ncbi:hypothetical protein ElyMa_005460300 [Elysia marginata]|uniref:Uncharacterized protein n=1 Tax=Elysia marginata TaxID=1093978 RepID=A0AAV4ENI7_9GAST|nr:hypothetical protein ElyMa_005460300 [Elysia marginata]
MLLNFEYLINAANIGAKYPSCFCKPGHIGVTKLFLLFLVLAISSTYASNSNPHPRISELCADTFRGFEGERIKGFQLQKAFVLVTPGHTGPPSDIVEALEGHRSEKVRAYPELLSAKKVVKGIPSKSSFKSFEALPSGSSRASEKSRTKETFKGIGDEQGINKEEREKIEELSVLGVVQLIKLGEFLAKRYFEQLKSVVAPPGESKNLAEATGELVHFQSLSAFLHGFLMEKQFVAANVAKVGASFCQVAGNVGSTCSTTHSTLKHLRFFVEEAFRKESVLFKNSKLTEFNVASMLNEGPLDISAKEAISHVSNKLCAERHHRRVQKVRRKQEEPAPASNDHINVMFSISDSHVSYLSSSKVFQSFAKLQSISLLKYADQWLTCSRLSSLDEESKSCKDNNDIKLVSVDSLSMLSLLTALSLPSLQHILPAARLVVEILHSSQNETKLDSVNLNFVRETVQQSDVKFSDLVPIDHGRSGVERMSENDTWSYNETSTPDQIDLSSKYVRVLYNGRVVTSNISTCAGYSMSSLGLCPYMVFKSLLLNLEQHVDLATSQNKSEL